jgi:hypothetical protein
VTVLAGDAPAANGALYPGDSSNRTLKFVANLGATSGSFSIKATDGKATTSSTTIALTFEGGALLAKPSISGITTRRAEAATSSEAKSLAGGVVPAACTGVAVAAPATLQVTAGTAEVVISAKGKTKQTGAPAGVRIDILPAGAAAGAAADPACSIKVPGAIKAGATKARKIPAKKLAACYNALKLADCAKPLQARATAIAGTKFKEGPASAPVTFTPACTPCAGRLGNAPQAADTPPKGKRAPRRDRP